LIVIFGQRFYKIIKWRGKWFFSLSWLDIDKRWKRSFFLKKHCGKNLKMIVSFEEKTLLRRIAGVKNYIYGYGLYDELSRCQFHQHFIRRFSHVDPKSVKRYSWFDWILTLLGAMHVIALCKYVGEIDPRMEISPCIWQRERKR